MNPKVSVIIATYNRCDFLRLAIKSVLDQTFQDFEIIVVDDNSQDNTSQVIDHFNDGRIKYIRHEFNRGIASVRNTGIQQSLCKYIAFLDDDDEWFPRKLEEQVNLIEKCNKNVGVIYNDFLVINKSTGKILGKYIPAKEKNISNEIRVRNCIGTCSSPLFRKECFDEIGLFDESITYGEDWDIYIRISKKFIFKYIKYTLVKYYIHLKNTVSSNNAERINKSIDILLYKHEDLALSKKNSSRLYLFLGVLYCYDNNLKKGREMILKSIRMYPFNIKYYYNLFISFFGKKTFKLLKRLGEREFI